MSTYENTQEIEKVATQLRAIAIQLNYKGELLALLDDPKTSLMSNKKRAKLNTALEKELQDIIDEKNKSNLNPAKESNEATSNLPSAVTLQEKKALAYFEKNNELTHIKVLNHIKNLREQGNISYEYLGGGKYAVIMLCGSKKLKMHFPADTKISDSKYSYTDRNDEEVITKETTRTKLWSKEGKKYLEQKEKEGQKILLESEFKTLIQSLYPEGSEQEQILAFMIATGFYGWMRLKDTTSNLQRAVFCSRKSDLRFFSHLLYDYYICSLVLSTFIV